MERPPPFLRYSIVNDLSLKRERLLKEEKERVRIKEEKENARVYKNEKKDRLNNIVNDLSLKRERFIIGKE